MRANTSKRRRFLKCNIPMFLNAIVACYLYFTFFFFHGSRPLALFLGTMTLGSLYMAALSHPGPVREWTVSSDVKDYCKQCETRKPPRAHHCRRCDECIRRFDHHCDWIDNCVGARNYKAFVLFLVYILGAITHFFWMFSTFVYFITCQHCDRSASPHLSASRVSIVTAMFVVIYLFVVIPCAILAVIFLGTTLWNAARNLTTYDDHVRSGDRPSYSKGFCGNMIEVFGRNPLCWLVPTMVDDEELADLRSLSIV